MSELLVQCSIYCGRDTVHFGTKTSRPTEIKVLGSGNKNFPSGLVIVKVSGNLLFYTL